MDSGQGSTNSALREAEVLVAIAERLHQLADEATEVARAACERANTLPLLERLNERVDRRDEEGR